VGSPLSIGLCNPTDGCGWAVYASNLPPPQTGLTMWYDLGFESLGSGEPSVKDDLESTAAPNLVINSLDIETAMGTYAASWVQTTKAAGFDYNLETIAMGDGLEDRLQAAAAADGASGRIVTAVSFDDAEEVAYVVSYGWDGDRTTAYEARTAVVGPDGVAGEAVKFAQDGYFVSAFGGNNADHYMLVGMRVEGDTMPRPVSTGNGLPANIDSAYFTPVVYLDQSLIVSEQ
jgi:hypothetical protein